MPYSWFIPRAFRGLNFLPQLCYASSNESPAPEASIMFEPCTKREVSKRGKPVADSQA